MMLIDTSSFSDEDLRDFDFMMIRIAPAIDGNSLLAMTLWADVVVELEARKAARLISQARRTNNALRMWLFDIMQWQREPDILHHPSRITCGDKLK